MCRRLIWKGRLYPVGLIKVRVKYMTANQFELFLNGSDYDRLRHAHDPRPYG